MLLKLFTNTKKVNKTKTSPLFSKKINKFLKIYSKDLIEELITGKSVINFVKEEKTNQILQGNFNINKKLNLVTGKKNILKNNVINTVTEKIYSNTILKNAKVLLLDLSKLFIGTKDKLELEIKLIILLNLILKKYTFNKFLMIENIENIFLNKEFKITENFDNLIKIFESFSNINYLFTLDSNYYNKQLKEINNSLNIFRVIELSELDIDEKLSGIKEKLQCYSIIYNINVDTNCLKEINYYSNILYPKLTKLESNFNFINELISFSITTNIT